MEPLQVLYTIVGICAGVGTVMVALRQAGKKLDEVVAPVKEAAQPLAVASDRLTAALQIQHTDHAHRLQTDVDQYAAVVAANTALRSVISDSTQQLADAAVQLAKSTEQLAAVREELRQAQTEKATLVARVAELERQVAILTAAVTAVNGGDKPC